MCLSKKIRKGKFKENFEVIKLPPMDAFDACPIRSLFKLCQQSVNAIELVEDFTRREYEIPVQSDTISPKLTLQRAMAKSQTEEANPGHLEVV